MTEHDCNLIEIAKKISIEDLPTIVARVALQEAVDATANILAPDMHCQEEERKGAIETLRQEGGHQLASTAKAFLKEFTPNFMVEAKKLIKELAPYYTQNVQDDGTIIPKVEAILTYSSEAVASRMNTILMGAPTDKGKHATVQYIVEEAKRSSIGRRDTLCAIQKVLHVSIPGANHIYQAVLQRIRSNTRSD